MRKKNIFFFSGIIFVVILIFAAYVALFPSSPISVKTKDIISLVITPLTNTSTEKLTEHLIQTYPYGPDTFLGAQKTPNQDGYVNIGGTIQSVSNGKVTILVYNDSLTFDLPTDQYKIYRVQAKIEDTIYIMPEDLRVGETLILTVRPLSIRTFVVERAQVPYFFNK